MFHIFKDLFNKEKLSALEKELEASNKYSTQLETNIKELEDYKLKYEIAQLYINDEEAILELLELKKKESSFCGDTNAERYHNMSAQRNAMAQQRAMQQSNGQLGMLGQAFYYH